MWFCMLRLFTEPTWQIILQNFASVMQPKLETLKPRNNTAFLLYVRLIITSPAEFHVMKAFELNGSRRVSDQLHAPTVLASGKKGHPAPVRGRMVHLRT
jgi:hypothetical protein